MIYVGIYLLTEVFTHVQLYVALSSIFNSDNLSKISKDGFYHTKNIVCKEIID